eukprot:jgi/Tetstr1/460743/TSEL_005928.t1
MMGGRLMEGTSQHGFQTATNVTMKMLSMTPAGLPPDLRQHMEFLMEAVPADVQGAMRPGCVFMSVDMWFANQEQLDRAKAALQLNIDTGKADELFERTDMDLYSQSTGYKVRRGRVVERFANQESCSIANAGPVVCNPGLTEWRAVVSTSSPDARIRMVCRVKGRFFDVAAREEAQLPDGRFQYALRAPLDDNALGLAWLEIIETLPGGDEAVSLPHPMFLTTRSDMCQEMSSLFETASPATRRDMAGILKDLEELLHPDDDEAPLDPTQPVMLALLCARHGFRQTLEEIIDEVEYRSCEGGVALMMEKAEQIYPGGIPLCARLSGSQNTCRVVRNRLLNAGDSDRDASTTTGNPTFLPDTVQQPHGNPGEDQLNVQASCDLFGEKIVKALKRPAVAATTMVCSVLLFSVFPWSRQWQLAHAVVITLSVHVLLPILYRLVYVDSMRGVQALALEKGVPLCHGGLCVDGAQLRRSFDDYALTVLNHGRYWWAFVFWLLFAGNSVLLNGLVKTGTRDLNWWIISVLWASLVMVFGLRWRTIKQSLLVTQRLNVYITVLPPALGLVAAYCAWASGTEFGSFPSVLTGNEAAARWVKTCAGMAMVKAVQGASLPLPLRDLLWYEVARLATVGLGGYYACLSLASHGPVGVPYAWVSWIVVNVPGSIVAIASRVVLEMRLIHGFLSQLAHAKRD